VAARASRTAAEVTVEPSLANFTISAVSMQARNSSAQVTSSGEGRVKLLPSASAAAAASTTGSNAWPRVTARSPMPYSMNSLPSTSQTRQPLPARMKPGASSGYWSSPFA
jgi:hypothetical protein